MFWRELFLLICVPWCLPIPTESDKIKKLVHAFYCQCKANQTSFGNGRQLQSSYRQDDSRQIARAGTDSGLACRTNSMHHQQPSQNLSERLHRHSLAVAHLRDSGLQFL